MRQKLSILILTTTILLGVSLILTPRASTISESGNIVSPFARAIPLVIPAGSDLYTTPSNGSSYWDFSVLSLGPGFFGNGSDEFSEQVKLKGLPLAPAVYGTTDTIVRRTEPAEIPSVGESATVRVELVALSLVSCNSFTVTYGGVEPEEWKLSVSVAESSSPGTMTIHNTCGFENGGSFDFTIAAFPILVFTRVSDGKSKTIDFSDTQIPWLLRSFDNKWSSSAPTRFHLLTVPSDPSRNFFPGVWMPPCLEGDCGARARALEVMIQQSWNQFPPKGMPVVAHGLLPTALPTSQDSDGDNIPNDADNCPAISNPLQEDSDRDSKGDVCDGRSGYDPCTVVIGGCDTSVPNHIFAPGVTFNDLIEACANGPDGFIDCVAHRTNEWKTAGLITGAQKGAIMRCAAHARP